MTFSFSHFNFNVKDMDRAVAFYEEALGLRVVRTSKPDSGAFVLNFLGDGQTDFVLELTWLRDWEKDGYDLGDNEMHLCLVTDDYDAAHTKHERMGCICYENPGMGLYFIEDPDGYWTEIVPRKRA